MTIDQTGTSKLQALGYSALQASFLWLVALHSGHLQRQARHRISEETGSESPLPDLPFGRQNSHLPPGLKGHLSSHRLP